MTAVQYNVSYLEPWTLRACNNNEKVFCMFTAKKSGEIQMYSTDEIKREDIIKQLRHIADNLESRGKIIKVGN